MESSSSTGKALVRMAGIGKSFDGVSVLRNVTLEFFEGQVLALVGENGAGKSTLMKILGGNYAEYDGQIFVKDVPVHLHSPKAADALGIRLIHQELSLIPAMSVAENIFLGREPRNRLGMVNWRKMRSEASRLLKMLRMDIDVSKPVEAYNIAVQQHIEIAKALSAEAKVLVMDEPTSALSEADADRLFEVIAQLKSHGVSIVYISHRMEEIYRLADQIAVLRDGNFIGCAMPLELPAPKLLHWMVGREVTQTFPQRAPKAGKELMTVRGLSVSDPHRPGKMIVDDVSLTLHEGEILGLAGLRGAGNSELLWSLFGAMGAPAAGEVTIRSAPYRPLTVQAAKNVGLALVTNDRKASGLVLPMDVVDNSTLASLWQMLLARVMLTRRAQRRQALPVLTAINIKARLQQTVGTLSGGNQQKVVLTKWLLTRPRVLLLDEPTRGIDVVAKQEIYQLLSRLAGEGMGILLIMSELPELLAMSDRILVMRRGRMTAELSRDQATPQNVTAAAM